MAILDSARPRLVARDAGPGSARGVGVSGCERWERGRRGLCPEGEGGARARARGPPGGVARAPGPWGEREDGR